MSAEQGEDARAIRLRRALSRLKRAAELGLEHLDQPVPSVTLFDLHSAMSRDMERFLKIIGVDYGRFDELRAALDELDRAVRGGTSDELFAAAAKVDLLEIGYSSP